MKILSIETSCDETAISLIEASGGIESPSFSVISNLLISQVNVHKEYGGVFPMLAKREHAKNLVPILKKALLESSLFKTSNSSVDEIKWKEIENLLIKEDGLYLEFRKVFEQIENPDIDLISVTYGPGLAPALWVGITFAEALGKLWEIPVIGINHMEGHIASVLMNKTEEFSISNFQFSNKINFPALALLISGGHTELVEIKNWGKYKIIGRTVDDAVGEAFDKVARMLGLPYPGGPEISTFAEQARNSNLPKKAKFPRPMIHSRNLDFSFSGLKTSVLYYIRDNFSHLNENKNSLTDDDRADIAREFEDAVVDVLINKTEKAFEDTGAKTLIIAGGVIANKKIRESFTEFENKYPDLSVRIPVKSMTTDNALMIAYAAYINITLYPELLNESGKLIAQGNLTF